jgi:hypothetical protein
MNPALLTAVGLNHNDCEYGEFPMGRYAGLDRSYND